MDFSKYPTSGRFYSGSERKIGILIGNAEWILKYQYNDGLKIRYNHISEHIGSSVFRSIGIDAQETELGTYNGEQVVACKNFVPNGCMFVPFNDVGESSLERDKELFRYTYDDVMGMLEANRKITNLENTVDTFWDVFIIDALLGNFDRHGANWGFLKCDDRYRMAPVFDNGSCLYPQMIDEDMMQHIMDSKKETEDRVYRFPTSQIQIGRRKSSYYDVISGMRFPYCNDALERVFPKIHLDRLFDIVDCVDSISDTHRDFYKHMIQSRYDLILKETYQRLER